MQELEHVLEVLKQTKIAVEQEDVIRLKDLSNQTIHSASISQDADNILVAVIIYSISKIIERTNYQDYAQFNSFLQSLKAHVKNSISALEKKDLNKFRFEAKKLRKTINKLSGNFRSHIKDVFRKAEVNKASRIYEHGISMEKTAKLLGISLWELAEYAGNTGISDVNLNKTMPEKKRIELALEMFK